jgi:hypothetical protein
MFQRSKALSFLVAAAISAAVSLPAMAGSKKFSDSDDAKKEDEAPQKFLKGYDKLVQGKEADWVWFAEGFDAKAFKTVKIKPYAATGKNSRSKAAAEDGPGYWDKWVSKTKLNWDVVKGGADLTIEGNIADAWEPSGAARAWGGWMANPGTCQEIIGKDSKGNTVFEIRHKSKGSTLSDAVENGIENICKSIAKGK